jgi:predicted transcriptional regulator
VRDVGVGLDEVPQAAPTEPVAAVLSRFASGDGHVLVLDGGEVVGLLTPADITRVLARGRAAGQKTG